MIGATLLLAALTLCAASPEGTSWQVFAGLFLLGLGWSCATVAGSTMVSDHSPLDSRTDVQGLTDLVMGVAAAAAGAVSGLIVAWWGYPVLSLLACVLPAAVGVAAYAAARSTKPVAAEVPEV
jgi:MFS family permease